MRASRPCFSFAQREFTFGVRPPLGSPRTRSRTSGSGHLWAHLGCAAELRAQATFGAHLGCAAELRAQATFGLTSDAQQNLGLDHLWLRPLWAQPCTSNSQQNSFAHGSSGSGNFELNHSPRIRSGISPFGAQAIHLECLRRFTFGAQANHLGRAAGV